ncbi:MAG: hypothetical protein JST00_13910 [Deltaproteobacteria bacterium]|nr:hypothetical protein [Deltaproteobacteria bacterium]
MKRMLSGLLAIAAFGWSVTAAANVNKTELFVGRLSKPESCFVQIDLKAVEMNLFNGQEKLRVASKDVTTFAPLQTAGKSLAVGKSVLVGSEAFKTEAAIEPDITIGDATCRDFVAGALVEMLGSFGPVSGELKLRDDFSELDVVGLALLVHLESESYRVKSLGGEKEIGKTAGSSSGTSGTSSGTTSGGASSSGASSGTSGTASTPPPAAGSSDSGCAVGRPNDSAPTGGAAIATIALAVGARLRRRRRA